MRESAVLELTRREKAPVLSESFFAGVGLSFSAIHFPIVVFFARYVAKLVFAREPINFSRAYDSAVFFQ